LRIQKKQLPIRPFDTVVKTTCPSCGAGCGLKVFIKDGRAVEIYGDEENQLNKGSLCPRGLMALSHLYQEKRLLVPLIRERLSDPFREATWEEALDHVAQKLQKSCLTSPESLYLRLSPHAGFGNIALGTVWGNHWGTPNIDSDLDPDSSVVSTVMRHMLGVAVNGCAMSARHEWSASQAMLLAGVDPATTDPVAFGHVLDAKDRGTRIMVLDSRNTLTMRKAHLSLKCRVGAEQTVLLAIAHVLLRENHGHEEFLKQWVVGMEDFQALCREYSPEIAENVSGVKKENILEAARVLARNFPSMVIGHSRGGSQETGAGLIFSMIALTAITGTIGCPGGGVNLLNNFPPIEIKSESSKEIKDPKGSLVRAGNGTAAWRAIAEGRPYPIRGIIWDTDPLTFCPEGRKVVDALRKMDLIVYLGDYPNAAYHHAHVVFPLTTFLETEGLVFSSTGRNIQWANRTVPPRGKTRPAEDFWGGLMARLNFSSPYPFIQEKGEVNIREMTRYFLQRSPLLAGITPELLDPERNLPGGIQWPAFADEIDFANHRAAVRGCEGLFQPGSQILGTDKRFPTPTGKIDLSPVKISAEPGFQNLAGIPALGKGLKANQLILITGEIVDFLPSAGFWAIPQKFQIPLFAQIHPKKARELGVQSGDRILLENGRGKMEAPVWVTDQVGENIVFCPSGADPYDPNFPIASPRGLFEFVPENDGHGRKMPGSTIVKARKAS
jgi:anaerobic selenocysteine-containing dehydrogenase